MPKKKYTKKVVFVVDRREKQFFRQLRTIINIFNSNEESGILIVRIPHTNSLSRMRDDVQLIAVESQEVAKEVMEMGVKGNVLVLEHSKAVLTAMSLLGIT
jgi:Asp-tRNA(Asn)/Glu-tRNA(Gln) amidotransferase C subunit